MENKMSIGAWLMLGYAIFVVQVIYWIRLERRTNRAYARIDETWELWAKIKQETRDREQKG
jgi:predicted membrane chloride channel (bestrophin family)